MAHLGSWKIDKDSSVLYLVVLVGVYLFMYKQ